MGSVIFISLLNPNFMQKTEKIDEPILRNQYYKRTDWNQFIVSFGRAGGAKRASLMINSYNFCAHSIFLYLSLFHGSFKTNFILTQPKWLGQEVFVNFWQYVKNSLILHNHLLLHSNFFELTKFIKTFGWPSAPPPEIN